MKSTLNETALALRFKDRIAAGQALAERLRIYAGREGVVVLGLARGGVPVAGEVARRLGAPLDVIVVRKLGVPCQEELAMGAIAPGGVCVLNDELIEALGIESDSIGVVRLKEQRELERREALYRGERPPLPLSGKIAIVVDDGIATGATMHAAVIFLHQQNPARLIVAAPVIAPDTFRTLAAAGDDVIAVIVPKELLSVGEWYDDFSATSDEEVRRVLTGATPAGTCS